MGGHISVGVRRLDGSFRTVLGSVGALKGYILDDRFMVSGNLESIDEYIAEWAKDNPDGSVPGPYGFVLIDAIDRVVLNWSGYDRLSTMSTSPLELGFTAKPDGIRVRWVMDEHQEYYRLQRDAVRKYAVAAERYDYVTNDHSPLAFSPVNDLDELIGWIDSQHARKADESGNAVTTNGVLMRFSLGSKHWSFIELRHENGGHARRVKAHLDGCVELTAEQEAEWGEWTSSAAEVTEDEE
jgi:hypothetical protein